MYNALLLASIALSGWAMWRYALHLTGDTIAALLAGIIFAFVPYRFDHFHHLELQATVFLPGKGCYRCLFPSPPPPGAC